jgi:catechol 2,3-dioxygenase-like lactoylglutathione lyase family enzyme
MNKDVMQQLNLPPVDQVGFVVRDLEQAIRCYEPLFGPFVEMDATEMEWNYRGEPAVSSLKLAMAQSGDVEIELIEWVSGATPHKEFLDAGREGLHHLRFMVDNVEEKTQQAEALGYRPIWYKRFAEGLAAVYLEREGDPLVIEFFENHRD